jgi:hypothetical protein
VTGPLAPLFAQLRRCPVHGIPDCSTRRSVIPMVRTGIWPSQMPFAMFAMVCADGCRNSAIDAATTRTRLGIASCPAHVGLRKPS